MPIDGRLNSPALFQTGVEYSFFPPSFCNYIIRRLTAETAEGPKREPLKS